MEIKGKVHCFFEQSGTFKNEFIKLGIPAEDYDIQNNFGETDHVIDLFAEIEKAYEGGGASIYDTISCDDLIMAFFPCIYFCAASQVNFSWGCKNHRRQTIRQKTDEILSRADNFYKIAIKMLAAAKERGLRLIMENPWSGQTYLKANFILPPTMVDNDRTRRGDFYIKRTAYWFINSDPTMGQSIQKNNHPKAVLSQKKSDTRGLCSEERSMISPDYARNFICDFILGKEQPHTLPTLF